MQGRRIKTIDMHAHCVIPEAAALATKRAGREDRFPGLVQEKADNGELANNLYLTFYSRLPTEAERKVAVAHLQRDVTQRRQAAEDLAWTLMG